MLLFYVFIRIRIFPLFVIYTTIVGFHWKKSIVTTCKRNWAIVVGSTLEARCMPRRHAKFFIDFIHYIVEQLGPAE